MYFFACGTQWLTPRPSSKFRSLLRLSTSVIGTKCITVHLYIHGCTNGKEFAGDLYIGQNRPLAKGMPKG